MSVKWGDDAPPTSPERCAEWVEEALFTEPQMRFHVHVDLGKKPGGDGSGGGMRALVKVAAWAGLAAAVWVMLVGLVVLVTVAAQVVAR